MRFAATVRQVYDRPNRFDGLDGFLTYLQAADPARRGLIAARRAAIEAAFARHAEPVAGGFLLRQPMILLAFTLP